MGKNNEIEALLAEEGLITKENDDGSGLDSGIEENDTSDTSEDNGTDSGQDSSSDRLSLKDLAERAKVESKDLYATLEVPLGNNEVMTLGDLKDLAVKGRTALNELDNTKTEYDTKHTELMVQRRELEQLAVHLPKELKDQYAAYTESQMQRELHLLAQAIPSWKDHKIAEQEQSQVYKLAAQYGFSKSDIEALVTDHRLVKLLRDTAVASERKASQPKPSPRPASQTNRAVIDRAKADGATKQDKLAAINALIN